MTRTWLILLGLLALPPKGQAQDPHQGFKDLLFVDRAGDLAPEIAFVDHEGQGRNLADFAGQVLVVNFWATWCAPCIAEMPALDRLNNELRDQNARVIAINTDFTAETGQAWQARNGLETLAFFWDETGDAFFDAGGTGMPYSLILSADGRIVAEVFGDAPWDGAEALEFIGALLYTNGNYK